MKKILLSAAVAVMAFASASAATDGVTYKAVNGINMTNNWVLDRAHTPEAFNTSVLNGTTTTRTGVMSGGKIYLAQSQAKQVIVENDTILQCLVHVFDAKNGNFEKSIPVTLDGKPYGVFLGINQIGTDNFGHLWISPYTSEKTATIPFYQFDPTSGALTLIATLDKGDKIVRTDYADVIGDVTRKEAGCIFMSPGAQSETVYRWSCEKGESEFEGGFSGDPYYDVTNMYPATCTQWGYAPTVRMVLGTSEDDMYTGDLFYIDGFNSAPILYSTDLEIMGSFEKVDSALIPEYGANGVAEFHLGDKNFVTYVAYQYNNHGCQVNLCELGPDQNLEGMKRYWQTDSLGGTSDGGLRVHNLNVEYSKDGNGNDVVTLFSFKTTNGMGVYTITAGETAVANINADNATVTVEGNVVKVSAPAAIEVYNLAGQKVASAAKATELTINAKGAYVVKAVAGNQQIVKKVVL